MASRIEEEFMQRTEMQTIMVQLNGIDTTVAPGSTLGGLIDGKGIERKMIAVEYNGEILPRHAYDATILNDGDRLEVVQMVGGG
ncbi:MAG: sulfur carrier protein ThiS [Vicinamibacterales bacterium]